MSRTAFWAGLGLIIAAELLLALDASGHGFPAARWVRMHMTPIAWTGYLMAFHGLLGPRGRPRRFWICFVTGVGVWSFFDWVNFRFIHAWAYHGLERLSRADVLISKVVAFGAISPAMFMAAAFYQRLGLKRLRTRGVPLTRPWQVAMFLAGLPCLAAPFIMREPGASCFLWISLVLVFDPVVHWFGRAGRRTPSLISDWQAGRFGRTVSLAAAGLTCGVLWEFWNYWAGAKWVYTLPFLGPLEPYKLFEMPLAGFSGFLPFALECWVAFNAIVLAMDAIGLRWAEALPDDDAVL